ncbi:hypothetical protein BGX26_006573 [Mortierella sp. AD094]|nr:hypothetical protein BGX26_006573 [Mortierella sp. AD094]
MNQSIPESNLIIQKSPSLATSHQGQLDMRFPFIGNMNVGDSHNAATLDTSTQTEYLGNNLPLAPPLTPALSICSPQSVPSTPAQPIGYPPQFYGGSTPPTPEEATLYTSGTSITPTRVSPLDDHGYFSLNRPPLLQSGISDDTALAYASPKSHCPIQGWHSRQLQVAQQKQNQNQPQMHLFHVTEPLKVTQPEQLQTQQQILGSQQPRLNHFQANEPLGVVPQETEQLQIYQEFHDLQQSLQPYQQPQMHQSQVIGPLETEQDVEYLWIQQLLCQETQEPQQNQLFQEPCQPQMHQPQVIRPQQQAEYLQLQPPPAYQQFQEPQHTLQLQQPPQQLLQQPLQQPFQQPLQQSLQQALQLPQMLQITRPLNVAQQQADQIQAPQTCLPLQKLQKSQLQRPLRRPQVHQFQPIRPQQLTEYLQVHQLPSAYQQGQEPTQSQQVEGPYQQSQILQYQATEPLDDTQLPTEQPQAYQLLPPYQRPQETLQLTLLQPLQQPQMQQFQATEPLVTVHQQVDQLQGLQQHPQVNTQNHHLLIQLLQYEGQSVYANPTTLVAGGRRTRQALSLHQKVLIIKFLDENRTVGAYYLNRITRIPRSTIYGILKNKEEIMLRARNEPNMSRVRRGSARRG